MSTSNFLRAVLVVAVLAAAGCSKAGGSAESAKPVAEAATPALGPGDPAHGREMFKKSCVYCHDARGFGTRMLKARLGDDEAVLELRTDLTVDYVQQIARSGIGAMPWYTRVELSDGDLNDVAAYLTQPKPPPEVLPAAAQPAPAGARPPVTGKDKSR